MASAILGFGTRNNLARQMTESPMATMQRIFEKMGGMKEDKRTQVAQLLGMREWRDEILTMVKVKDDLQRALKAISDNPGFLDRAAAERLASLQGRWNSFKAAFLLFFENFGSGLEELFTDTAGYLTDLLSGFDGKYVRAHVQGFLNGIVDAFGVSSWRELLERAFGKPGQTFDYINTFFEFGRGFANGLKSVFSTIAGAFKMMAGILGDGSPEALGKLVGQIIGLSAALLILNPLLSGLAAVVSFIGAFASFAKMFSAAGSLLGGLAEGGIAAGGWAAVGGYIGRGFLKLLAFGARASWIGVGLMIADGIIQKLFGMDQDSVAPGSERLKDVRKMTWGEWWDAVRGKRPDADPTGSGSKSYELPGGAKVQKQSYDMSPTGAVPLI